MVPREMGLMRLDLGWPRRRDDADNFWTLGHHKLSAAVAATLLRAAAPAVDWSLVLCGTYACVVGNARGRGTPVLVDLAASPVGYDAVASLAPRVPKEDLSRDSRSSTRPRRVSGTSRRWGRTRRSRSLT